MKKVSLLLCLSAALISSGCSSRTKPYYISLSEGANFTADLPDPTPHSSTGKAPASDVTRYLIEPPLEVSVIAGIHDNVPLPPLNLYPYIIRTREIFNFYAASTEGTFNDRLRRRNSEIRQLFSRFESDRGSEVRRHQLFQGKDTRCKNSRTGRVKVCPDSLSWETDYEVIAQSIAHTQRHFKSGPAIGNPYQIVWEIGKAGKGTNHGHVKGTAKYSSAKAAALVDEGKQQLRIELQAHCLPTDQVIDPLVPTGGGKGTAIAENFC